MKKLLPAFTFMLFASILTVACNKKEENHPDKNLHISGTVKGLRKGTLYIKKITDTTFVTLDSIAIDGNPYFESYLNIDSPEMYYLFLNRGESNSMDDKLLFFAEPGDIKINTRLDAFYSKAKITGSENQKLFEDYLKIKALYTGKNLDLIEAGSKTENAAKLDSITNQQNKLLRRHYIYTVNFCVNHGEHEVAPYVALSELPYGGKADVKYLDTISKSMTPKVAASRYGKLLNEYLTQIKKED